MNGVYTTWNGTDRDNVARARGYMLHLAYQIQPPTWPRAGINMQQADWNNYPPPKDRGTGAVPSIVRDGLNWEASAEGSYGNWSTYFYATNSSTNPTVLHAEVAVDIADDNMPVVVEVNTNGLPNWNPGSNTIHYITIIGYNDDYPSGPIYMYTDTCANITGCGSNSNGGVQIASQSTLFSNTYEWVW